MRLIDADAFERAVMFSDDEDLQDVIYRLRDFPTIEPERKKGRWIWSKENSSWCCSACRCVFEEIEWKPEYNFCPNCGAYMGGEQDGKA